MKSSVEVDVLVGSNGSFTKVFEVVRVSSSRCTVSVSNTGGTIPAVDVGLYPNDHIVGATTTSSVALAKTYDSQAIACLNGMRP